LLFAGDEQHEPIAVGPVMDKPSKEPVIPTMVYGELAPVVSNVPEPEFPCGSE